MDLRWDWCALIRKVLAVLLGVIFSVLIFCSLEIFFQLNEKYEWFKPSDRDVPLRMPSAEEISHDEKLAEELLRQPDIPKWIRPLSIDEEQRLRPWGTDTSKKGKSHCCTMHGTLNKGGPYLSQLTSTQEQRLIYSVSYQFDDRGRRLTPVRKNARAAIIMMGCSFTLGEGVQDSESAPWLLGEMRKEFQVYNLGVSAGGPGQSLWELSQEKIDRLDGIHESKRIVVFTYMANHLERVILRSEAFTPFFSWILTMPHFKEVGDRLVYQGPFHDTGTLRNFVYQRAAMSSFLRFFKMTLPPRFTDADYKFHAKMIQEIARKSQDRLGPIDFYFVLYPGLIYDRNHEKVAEAVRALGIKVLDYTRVDIDKITESRAWLPIDGHPSPVGNYIFAHLLDRDLPK